MNDPGIHSDGAFVVSAEPNGNDVISEYRNIYCLIIAPGSVKLVLPL